MTDWPGCNGYCCPRPFDSPDDRRIDVFVGIGFVPGHEFGRIGTQIGLQGGDAQIVEIIHMVAVVVYLVILVFFIETGRRIVKNLFEAEGPYFGNFDRYPERIVRSSRFEQFDPVQPSCENPVAGASGYGNVINTRHHVVQYRDCTVLDRSLYRVILIGIGHGDGQFGKLPAGVADFSQHCDAQHVRFIGLSRFVELLGTSHHAGARQNQAVYSEVQMFHRFTAFVLDYLMIATSSSPKKRFGLRLYCSPGLMRDL